jgi:hypothetical protein
MCMVHGETQFQDTQNTKHLDLPVSNGDMIPSFAFQSILLILTNIGLCLLHLQVSRKVIPQGVTQI